MPAVATPGAGAPPDDETIPMLNLSTFSQMFLPAVLLAAPDPSARPPATQPAVTVTASRQVETVDRTLAAVEIIERESIVRSQARDVLELLRSHPGVDIARSGGPGQQTSVFLRGTNSNHVLVLIDGVRVAASNTGAYTFEHLPLAHIERIEIVRGPRAALYGSDAIGGVIQIFTRSGPGSHALLSAGSYRHLEAAAGHGIGDQNSSLYLSASRRDFRGFSATNPGISFGHDPDRDGTDSTRFALAARHRFSDTLSGTLSVLGSDADIEFDQGESRQRDHSIALALKHQISARWTQDLRAGTARNNLETPAFDARFHSQRRQLDWLHDLELDAQTQLGFGVNALRDQGYSADLAGNRAYGATRDSLGGYLRLARSFETLRLDGSARYDDYDGFGGELTGQLGLGWTFDTTTVFASFGEGFRAPNLNELFSPGFGGFFAGNPALEPERSRSLEVGARVDLADAGQIEMQVYRSRIRDLIAFEGGDMFQAINVARADIDGAEWSWRLKGEAWQARFSQSWADPENALTGAPLLRRARHKTGVEADYTVSARLSVGTELSHTGRRADVGGVVLGDYTLIALRGRLRFADGWAVEARLDNLGDADYELIDGYNTAGRSAQLSLRYGD